MFYRRNIEEALKRYLSFPVISILGPRQSGKTTLVKNYFKDYKFLSLEKPVLREFAKNDPEGFLHEYENQNGIIIDEFQYVPELLSYIQIEVDEKKRPGYFVLTGSQNFLANQSITQSLAGRVGILKLLPFSIDELFKAKLLPERAGKLIIEGCYPRVFTENIDPSDLYSSYIHTYVQKDVRQLVKVGDLLTFQKFLSLCAGRIGQELRLSDLATVCGISSPTAKNWISILESSYILFLLPPYFNNFNKRLTKAPKLYFYDTGLASSLINLNSSEALAVSPFKGPLFENLIISDFYKQFFNMGKNAPLYFWRDQNGRIEVDCLIDYNLKLTPVEIKSSQTLNLDFFNGLIKWNEISKTESKNNYVVYSGFDNQKRKPGQAIGWKSAGTLVKNSIVNASSIIKY